MGKYKKSGRFDGKDNKLCVFKTSMEYPVQNVQYAVDVGLQLRRETKAGCINVRNILIEMIVEPVGTNKIMEVRKGEKRTQDKGGEEEWA